MDQAPAQPAGYKKRLFWMLWVPGIIGVLSFLLVDLQSLIAAIPQPAGESVELPPPALLKLASIVQPAILVTLAVAVGVRLASKVGLHSPAAEAAASRGNVLAAIKPQVVPAWIAGAISGLAIVLTWVVAKPFFSDDFITRAEGFNKLIPFTVRVLYGGITEELLLRWGFMTFVVWAAYRLLQKGEGGVKPAYIVIAVFISALLFGAGHLPVASALSGGLSLPIVVYVMIANSIFGIAAGLLYWKRGLESAMIAHMFAHVVLFIAITLGL
jgi:hypothetical protein